MTRRHITALLVVAIFGLVAFITWRGQHDPKPTIVVFGEDSSNLNAYKLLASGFESKTGVAVEFESATFEQSIQKADAEFRNGGSGFDIVLQYNFSLAPYVKNDYIAGIEEAFSPEKLKQARINEGLFPNAVRETCFYYGNSGDSTAEPSQFGFPFAANTMLLVYNRDLFENPELAKRFKTATGNQLAPPTDWTEYMTLAEFFSTTSPPLKGVCMQGASDGWLYYELCNYLFSMGSGTSRKANGWEKTNELTIATPENEEVLRYYKRLQGFSSGDFFTVAAYEQQRDLLDGNCAMGLVWSDYLQPLSESQSPRFGFTPVPGDVSGLAGGAFYINRKTKNMDAASDFVLFALLPENQTKLVEEGLCSPLKAAYTEEVLDRVPYALALRDSLERGVFMFEAGTDAEIINVALTKWVQKYIRGETSESEALREAEAEILAKRQNQKY